MKKLFVIFAAIAMVGAFTATAMAADWAFYGSARVETTYGSQNKDLSSSGDSVTLFSTDLNGTSRVGARVKASDALSGRFEYGASGSAADGYAGQANIRLLYGTWNFGAGSLTVGQNYTPGGGMTNGSQALAGDYGMYTFGLYEGRKPQVTVSMGGFSFGIVQNLGSANIVGNDEGPDGDWAAGGIETQIPRLEAGWWGAFGNFSVGVIGGYQTWKSLANDKNIDTMGVGASFGGAFGPASFTLQGAYSSNGGYIWAGHGQAEIGADVEDTTTMNFTGSVGFAPSDMIYVEGGVGWRQFDNDTYDKKDSDMVYYVNCKITMAPGVFVVPEVSVFDLMKDKDDLDQGTATLVGAKWQIDF
jgi:hypothetical protein